MNLPLPVNKNNWTEHTSNLQEIASEVLEEQLADAALRLKRHQAASGKLDLTDDTDETVKATIADVSVSVDLGHLVA